jgi:hypothetical protein
MKKSKGSACGQDGRVAQPFGVARPLRGAEGGPFDSIYRLHLKISFEYSFELTWESIFL